MCRAPNHFTRTYIRSLQTLLKPHDTEPSAFLTSFFVFLPARKAPRSVSFQTIYADIDEDTVQCVRGGRGQSAVLCCADDAALCWGCDEKIHAANKLASKHQRVPLSSSSSSSMPKCDICQETIGYFFCLEDRALLCRKCDVAIHRANSYVSSHQQFLLTWVKVGFEATEPFISLSTEEKLSSVETVSESASSSRSIPRNVIDHYSTGEIEDTICMQNGGTGTLVSDKIQFNQSTTLSAANFPGWHELLGLTDPDQNYGCLNTMPSKVYGSYCA